MELNREHYRGREQAFAKHCILQGYLRKLALKIGWDGATINYIDGFAGPWRSQAGDLSDTSPHIALGVLREAQRELARCGRPATRRSRAAVYRSTR